MRARALLFVVVAGACGPGARPAAGPSPTDRPGDPIAAAPIELTRGHERPWAIAVLGERAYFTTQDAVMSVGTALGGEAVTLAAGQAHPTALALDAMHVYWVTEGEGQLAGAVMRVPRDGGVPTKLAGPVDRPSSIAVDATHVYWTEAEAIARVPREGGDRETLYSGTTLAGRAVLGHVILLDQRLYWSDGDTIMSAPTAGGGTPVRVARDQQAIIALAGSGDHLYWATQARLATAPVEGGAPVELAAATMTLPPEMGLVVDEEAVFFGGFQGGIWRVPRGGGAAARLYQGPHGSMQLAQDAAWLYWTAWDGGWVLKAPKRE